ncbi:MAG: electron transfer flavoprotein subunit beta/FixA family protein [Actinomycetota bacterium]
MGPHIVVFVKVVPDPEGPPSSFEVVAAERMVLARGIPPVINPFDENALEAAIRIKEKVGGTITLLSLGRNLSRAVILKAVAAGADASVLVEGDSLDQALLDSRATATLLAAALRTLEPFDLVLCGRQASDTNAGVVGLGVAQILGIPAVTLARKVEVVDDRIIVERALSDGYEVVDCSLPALVTVSGEAGDLRYPSLQAIRAAKELPQKVVKPEELGAELPFPWTETVSLEPPRRERSCRLVEADSPAEAGEKLAVLLREERVI